MAPECLNAPHNRPQAERADKFSSPLTPFAGISYKAGRISNDTNDIPAG